MKEKLLQTAKALPKVPGAYLFKDKKGVVIYVGKAKDLRSRVSSYFVLDIKRGTKTAALVRQITAIDFIEVESELEALILEAKLIKKYSPKYNILQKDDKSYLYIVIRNENVKLRGKETMLPRVLTARETDLKKDDKVFGPYPHGNVARHLIRAVRKMFPYRDCASSKFQRYHKLDQPCLYGHLKLCSAPCTSKITAIEYKKQIKRIEKFLKGESTRVTKSIGREMKKLSKEMKYEEAAEKRDILEKISYVTKRFRDPKAYMANPYLVEDIIASSLDDLVENVPYLTKLPKRIECYDISNLSGGEATGSMVVATNGRIDKSQYRKFKIKKKKTPDDFEMMREVFRRRFKNKWEMPDLFVVDGGKGQVSAATDIMKELNLNIPVIGLAKRFETVVLEDFSEVRLEKSNEGLKLLQRLRDESHRFAKEYHLKLRLAKFR